MSIEKIEDESVSSVILGCLVVLASGIIGTIGRGLVLAKLWFWFLVQPLSIPEIGTATALGISILASYMTYRDQPIRETNYKNFLEFVVKTVVMSVGLPLCILFFGWLVHQFQ